MSDEIKKEGRQPVNGDQGFMASNVTGQKIEPLFDYGVMQDNSDSRNPDLVKAVEEITEFLKQNPDLPSKQAAELIKNKFHLEEVPIMKVEDSLWYQFTKDEKLGQTLQGWREDKNDGKKIRIPHVAFSADLDYLDGFINRIIKKAKDLNIV